MKELSHCSYSSIVNEGDLLECYDVSHERTQPLWVQEVEFAELGLEVIEVKNYPALMEKVHGLLNL